MKKLLTVVLCGLILYAIEYVILFFCAQLESVLKHSVGLTKINGAFRIANEISAIRFLFYFTIWVVIVFLANGKFDSKYPVLKLALLNSGIFLLVSVVMTLFFPFAIEYFSESFFYYLCIATFISPFILSFLPFANKLIRYV